MESNILLQLITAGLGWILRATRRRPRTREQLLAEPIRRDIVKSLLGSPGISMSELGRRMHLPWSTLQYHLRLLRAAGLVSSHRLGREQHLFGSAPVKDTVPGIALLRRRRVLEIVNLVVKQPGLRQRDIIAETSLHRKSLRQCVDLLKVEDLVLEVREARSRRYFPTRRLTELLELLREAEHPSTALNPAQDDDPPGAPQGPPPDHQ